jgi:hypothetical protein
MQMSALSNFNDGELEEAKVCFPPMINFHCNALARKVKPNCSKELLQNFVQIPLQGGKYICKSQRLAAHHCSNQLLDQSMGPASSLLYLQPH